MTLSYTGVRAVFDGSGSAGPFTLTDADANPISFINSGDLVVIKIDTASVMSVLTLTVDYTVSGGSGASGSVTLEAPLATGEQIVIYRLTDLTQDLDLISGGRFSQSLLEGSLDAIIRLIQESEDKLRRAILLPVNYVSDQILAPMPEYGKVLMWNEDEDGLENRNAGASFYHGHGAPTSGTGDVGDFYLDIDTYILYGPKTSSWPSVTVSIIGPKGDEGDASTVAGPAGTSVRYGDGAPSDLLGNDGDFYIDTDVYDIYGPKTAGGWPLPESLIGPTGDGTGDVLGPAGATSGNIAIFSGSTGKIIADSTVTPASLLQTITLTGDVTGSGTGSFSATIAARAVSFAKVQAIATDVILGRDTASSGDIEQLTLDDTLEFTGSGGIQRAALSGAIQATAGSNVTTATAEIAVQIGDGANVITTGVKGYIPIDFDCTITQATLIADVSGSLVIDIWKDTWANFPPTVADTITASAKPTLSSTQKAKDATLTGWTKTITAGDVLGFNVDSVATCKLATLALKVTKTS